MKKKIGLGLTIAALFLVSMACSLVEPFANLLDSKGGELDNVEVLQDTTKEISIEPDLIETVEIETAVTEIAGIDYADATLYRGNPERTGLFDSPSLEKIPVISWRIESAGSILSSPAIHAGAAYYSSQDGVSAVDANTGYPIWSFSVGGSVESSPAVWRDLVYFGSLDGSFYAVDIGTGEALWTFETGEKITSSPLVYEGVVYFGSYDGFMYALDAQTGSELWRFEVDGVSDPASGITKAIHASPAIADGVLLFGSAQVGGASAELYFYGVDSQTGTMLWQFPVWNGLTSPAVSDGVVYFGSYGAFFGLDVATGTLVFQYRTDIVSTAPAISGRVAVFGCDPGFFEAVDLDSGQQLWAFQVEGWVATPPSIADGVVYFGVSDGLLRALDLQTGEIIWQYAADEGQFSSPVISSGMVYFGSEKGYLYALYFE